jgi:hypothetical protein
MGESGVWDSDRWERSREVYDAIHMDVGKK